MDNPPPPSFPMEMEKKETECDVLEELMRRISQKPTQDFENSLNEKNLYGMTMPSGKYRVLWRPNNYRRQMNVKTRDRDSTQKIKSAISHLPTSDGKILTVKGYKGCTIQYGKDNIICIYSQKIIKGHKETFFIADDDKIEFARKCRALRDEIRLIMDEALHTFVHEFDLGLRDSRIIWLRHEDWYKGTTDIKGLPHDCITYQPKWKKVYGEGIEAQGGKDMEPVEDMIQHINNAYVCDHLTEIKDCIQKESNRLVWVKTQVCVPLDVLDYRDDILLLSVAERRELEEYLFNINTIKG